MGQGTITTEDADTLIDELADALQRMVESSCGEMVPLWLAGTRLVRRDLPNAVFDLGFAPSERYQRLSRGTQNRYRQLACWRLAVLWRGASTGLEDNYGRALRAVYFTSYPGGEPPYAWSKRVSDAPQADLFPSPSTLKNWAKEGCWGSVQALREQMHAYPDACGCREDLERAFVKTGCRNTLRDVLKLDDHFPPWKSL